MNLCSDTHEEVCYEGRKCPMCEMIQKVTDFEDEIFGLKEKIEELQEAE